MEQNKPVTPSRPTGDQFARVQDKVKTPSRPTGPNASAIIAGLVAVLMAGLVIARETMNLRVDWSRTGPGTIVGLGVVLVVIGAVGLVRRRSDDT